MARRAVPACRQPAPPFCSKVCVQVACSNPYLQLSPPQRLLLHSIMCCLLVHTAVHSSPLPRRTS